MVNLRRQNSMVQEVLYGRAFALSEVARVAGGMFAVLLCFFLLLRYSSTRHSMRVGEERKSRSLLAMKTKARTVVVTGGE